MEICAISDFYDQINVQLDNLDNLPLHANKKITDNKKQIKEFIERYYPGRSINIHKDRPIDRSPEIIVTKSPMACQAAAYIMQQFENSRRQGNWLHRIIGNREHPIQLWARVEESFLEAWETNLITRIREFIPYTIWHEVMSDVKHALQNYMVYSENFWTEGNFNVMSLSERLRRPVLYNNELIQDGVYEMILLCDFCIVSELPIRISKNKLGKLHSQDNSAVEWPDGFGLYFWNGIKVPREWIVNSEIIDSKTILSERNIERRRCLMEILGTKRYFDLLNVACIDSDTDVHGNPIKLYRTRDKEPTIDEFLYYLFVVDPSTKSEYFIPVPPSYDVQWAKAATFNHKRIQYRQGDVGLLNLEVPFSSPLVET